MSDQYVSTLGGVERNFGFVLMPLAKNGRIIERLEFSI